MNFVIGLKALLVKCKINILNLIDVQTYVCICKYIMEFE